MRCEEFELALQPQAEGSHAQHDEAALRRHAQGCPTCRELEDGFRLVTQAFACSRPPVPAAELADRIVAAFDRSRPVLSQPLRPWVWRAAAACLLGAIGFWTLQKLHRSTEPPAIVFNSPLTTHHSPSDEPLFPDLDVTGVGDPRDGVVLIEAVEPVTEIFRAVGRILGSPVRPIAVTAGEVLGNFLKDLPEPDSLMMPIPVPGMREMMPQQKKMNEMGPSS